MKVQHTYTEAHSDDITAVAFHPYPALSHALLSGSVDGLINTYDVRIADEDDAVQSTSQVGASLAHAGWMALRGQGAGQELKGVYGATTIETLQYWDIEQVRARQFPFLHTRS
jgi:WD40 repeat protein